MNPVFDRMGSIINKHIVILQLLPDKHIPKLNLGDQLPFLIDHKLLMLIHNGHHLDPFLLHPPIPHHF